MHARSGTDGKQENETRLKTALLMNNDITRRSLPTLFERLQLWCSGPTFRSLIGRLAPTVFSLMSQDLRTPALHGIYKNYKFPGIKSQEKCL